MIEYINAQSKMYAIPGKTDIVFHPEVPKEPSEGKNKNKEYKKRNHITLHFRVMIPVFTVCGPLFVILSLRKGNAGKLIQGVEPEMP